MLHYHGTPITPRSRLLDLVGRCFCVRYGAHDDLEIAHEIGQATMLDNGAFSFWTKGASVDWHGYYRWCEPWLDYQTTWAVIPDVIDGGEVENDALIVQWPFEDRGAPVWHMHEPIERLLRLSAKWPRVCLGSSGDYAIVGDERWHRRMGEAMDVLCGDGPAPVWLHMLRGMALSGSHYPFASVDSTNIAQNHNRGNGVKRDIRVMADGLDGRQCAARWRLTGEQMGFHHELSQSNRGKPAADVGYRP